MRFVVLAALCACQAGVDSSVVDAPPVVVSVDAAVDALVIDAPPPPPAQLEWLRGSTHVHSNGSGDSPTPVPVVVDWYAQHDYDFIVITDHNIVTPAVSDELIVIPGVELTHNPNLCLPRQHSSGRCRVHVNLLGVTAPPVGRFNWANFGTRDRLVMYDAALTKQQELGGLVQLNHPTNYFGMTADLLVTLAEHGYGLVEIWNAAFVGWDRAAGRRAKSSITLWDQALMRGARLYGVATDDAHHFRGDGKYGPGGGWIMVHARRDQASILAAIAAGDFYASTGVELTRLEVVEGVLQVEAAEATGIDFIEAGEVVETVPGNAARHRIPETGYVRAVVRGKGDQRAWTQPHWR